MADRRDESPVLEKESWMVEIIAETLIADYADLHRRLREAVAGLDAAALDGAPVAGANSLCVLITHLLASELDWLGTAAGQAVRRDRESEFATTGRGAEQLTAQITATAEAIPSLIHAALANGLTTVRHQLRMDREVTVAYCLLHSVQHTAEHVGHVELTRQLIEATRG